MTERSVTHGSFVIERSYPATPARVFAAFSTADGKARWFADPADPQIADYEFDFRTGGGERFISKHERATFTYESLYYDIVPGRRIVLSYEMYSDDVRMSVSVATVEIAEEGAGAQLTYTEQGVFLDGIDKSENREYGTTELLDKLGDVLRADATED
jgi:uncharacterized protein YndB with AHSA1/START domain